MHAQIAEMLPVDPMPVAIAAPCNHWMIVYTRADGSRTVSKTHMEFDRAKSLAALMQRTLSYSSRSTFTVEDERDRRSA